MSEEKISLKKRFSIIKRAQSFTHAGRGLSIFVKGTHNLWIHLTIFVFACILGFYLNISRFEWIILVLASSFVIVVEAINTAIEIDIDLTSPTYHPYAKDTKDVAAAAVLIASLSAFVIGLIIFIPYILEL